MAFVLSCTVDLVDGACPESAAAWVEIPDGYIPVTVTPADIDPLLNGVIILWTIAASVRFVVRAIRS